MQRPLINTPHQIFSNATKAQETAVKLQNDADNDGWNYIPRTNSNGSAVIEVYDETGYFLGML